MKLASERSHHDDQARQGLCEVCIAFQELYDEVVETRRKLRDTPEGCEFVDEFYENLYNLLEKVKLRASGTDVRPSTDEQDSQVTSQ